MSTSGEIQLMDKISCSVSADNVKRYWVILVASGESSELCVGKSLAFWKKPG
ncbi:MAG: hypothetical protein H6708_19845 [Kofleriaceae bacterium]|nr:hypothetical protein [Kofleriaceae bacterium]